MHAQWLGTITGLLHIYLNLPVPYVINSVLLEITTLDDRSTLVVSNLNELDTGDISCVITNQNGSETCTAKLSALGQFYSLGIILWGRRLSVGKETQCGGGDSVWGRRLSVGEETQCRGGDSVWREETQCGGGDSVVTNFLQDCSTSIRSENQTYPKSCLSV